MPPASDRERMKMQKLFCEAYSACGTITHAAKAVNIAASTHYGWLEQEKEGRHLGYADMFAEAQRQYCDRLEREIDRRAIEGWDEPVFYKGEECGRVRKFSDNLLMFRTKKELPHQYRDNSTVELSGSVGLTVSALDEVLKAARAAKSES